MYFYLWYPSNIKWHNALENVFRHYFCRTFMGRALYLCCYLRRLKINPRSARAARGSLTSSCSACPRPLHWRSTKSTRHRSYTCSADSTSLQHNRQTASTETPTNCYQRRTAERRPLRKRATSVRSVLEKDDWACSSGETSTPLSAASVG